MTRRDWLWIVFVVWFGLGVAHDAALLTLLALGPAALLVFPKILNRGDRGPRVVEVDDDDVDVRLDDDLRRKREPTGRYTDPDIDDLDI